MDADETGRALAMFRKHDDELLQRQFAVFRDEARLIQTSREAAKELELLLEEDRRSEPSAAG